MISVLADKYLYNIEKFLPDEANLTLFDPDEPLHEIPAGTHALLIRTVTKINPATFPTFPQSLRFIGTGSAGTDHIDADYLNANDIAFANAAGCNARSVAEYVTVSLLLWAEETGANLSNLQVGIIGAGHTGTETRKLLQAMDITTVAYDPPRQARESGFSSASLHAILASDILTFHVPLSRETTYPTYHWLDEQKLKNHSFSLIINAARGGVVDERPLLEACRRQSIKNYVLDVWENEPNFNDEIARHAYIKTPHIAGYSVEAKERASKMIAKALGNHFSLPLKKQESLTKAETSLRDTPASFWSPTDVLTHYHPLRDYELRFKMLIGRSKAEKVKGFNRIRSQHPLRHEFRYLTVPQSLKTRYKSIDNLFK